jgi:phage major head subunit gpT-like protein
VLITPSSIQALFTGFRGDFQKGFNGAVSQRARISTEVPSSSRSNTYGWMGNVPALREWLGDRIIHGMKAHGYTITNKSYEATIEVPRPAIQDDEVGVYSPIGHGSRCSAVSR